MKLQKHTLHVATFFLSKTPVLCSLQCTVRFESRMVKICISTLLKSPCSQKCVFLLSPAIECFTLYHDLSAEFCTRRPFSHSLLRVYIFSELIKKQVLGGRPMSVICDHTFSTHKVMQQPNSQSKCWHICKSRIR